MPVFTTAAGRVHEHQPSCPRAQINELRAEITSVSQGFASMAVTVVNTADED